MCGGWTLAMTPTQFVGELVVMLFKFWVGFSFHSLAVPAPACPVTGAVAESQQAN